jgi:hypothetical protein
LSELLEFGIGWKPFERGVHIEGRKDLVTLSTASGPAFDIVTVNRDGSGTVRAKFTDAQSYRTVDRGTASTPRRGTGAVREQRRQRIAAVEAMFRRIFDFRFMI